MNTFHIRVHCTSSAKHNCPLFNITNATLIDNLVNRGVGRGGAEGAAAPPPNQKKEKRREEREGRGREKERKKKREKRNQKRKEVDPVIPRTCGHGPLVAPDPLRPVDL